MKGFFSIVVILIVIFVVYSCSNKSDNENIQHKPDETEILNSILENR